MNLSGSKAIYPRRDFLKAGAVFAAGAVALDKEAFWGQHKNVLAIPVGICAPYASEALLRELGYDFIEENVGRFLIPDAGDVVYQQSRAELKEGSLPVRSYTSFFPKSLKSVGQEIHHEKILERADAALKRAAECGSRNIVFGSGGSRAIPEGFDRDIARKQHVDLSGRLALLAGKHGVTVSIEPLNREETNFINSLQEGAEIVEAVNHPRFRMVCDIYHMLRERESPQDIVRFGKYIAHCHIAEREGRTAPGVRGDDFRPYLRALKTIGYHEGISLECKWQHFDKEASLGLNTLKRQMAEV